MQNWIETQGQTELVNSDLVGRKNLLKEPTEDDVRRENEAILLREMVVEKKVGSKGQNGEAELAGAETIAAVSISLKSVPSDVQEILHGNENHAQDVKSKKNEKGKNP